MEKSNHELIATLARSSDEGAPEAPAPGARMALASGYAVEALGAAADILQIKAPDGRICLKITLLPEGPMVELASASLSIAAQGDIKLDCGRLAINAERDVAIRAGGDVTTRAEGSVMTEGFSQHLRARRGDIELKANDDVFLDGERVRLNSPRTPAEERAQRMLKGFAGKAPAEGERAAAEAGRDPE